MKGLSDTSWLEAIPDAVVITDVNGVIVYGNTACEALLGWPPDEIRGQTIEQLVPKRHANHAALREAFLARSERRPMGGGARLAAMHRSGLEIPVDIMLSPLCIKEVRYVLATIRSMETQCETERWREVLTVAVNSAASGVVITDQAGKIVWANPAACRISGYAKDELIGRNPKMLKSGHHDDAFYRDLWSTVAAGETWNGAIVNRRKDGSLYHEEQTIAPVVGPGGVVTHYIAIKQDVTARVEAEAKLQTMSNAIQNAANGIALTDLAGKIRFANPAMLSLWCCSRSEDMTCRNMIDLWRDRGKAQDMLAAVLQAEGMWFGEAMALRDDTGSFPVQIAASQNRDASGAISGLVFSFNDISDRRRAEAAMEQAAAQKAMLASLAAACHHIGQPATVIVANCAILERLVDGAPDNVKEILAETRKSCNELQELMHRLTTVDVYKTEHYLEKPHDGDAPSNQIVQI